MNYHKLGPPTNWIPPKAMCVVATTGRSGSSLLTHSMTLTGVFGQAEEYFNPIHVKSLFNVDELSIENTFRLIAARSSSNGVASTKLHWQFMEKIAVATEFSIWFPNTTWVWLRRRDMLGQAISQMLAEQTGAWSSNVEKTGPEYYDQERISQIIETSLAFTARWETYFVQRGIVPLEIWYEDFQDNVDSCLSKIATAMGIELPASYPQTTLRKQRDNTNAKFRSKYINDHGNLKMT